MTIVQNSYRRIMRSHRPVLAVFYGEDCPACHAMKQVIERIEREYTGTLLVLSLDVSEEAELVQKYGIQSVPFLMLFKDGKVISEYPGFIPYESLKDVLDRKL